MRAAKELLSRVGAKVAGMAMNDVSPRAGYYYGGHRHGHGYYGAKEEAAEEKKAKET